MGWVVSKPLKVDLNEEDNNHCPLENQFLSSTSSLERFSNNSNHKYFDVVLESKDPSTQCDILVINHEFEYCESLNLMTSSTSNEESLCPIPIDVMERVELSTDCSENKLENRASTSSPLDIRICQKGGHKMSSKQLSKVEKKKNSGAKLRKYTTDEIKKNVENKSSTQKRILLTKTKSHLKENIISEKNLLPQSLKKAKSEFIKTSKKLNSKRSISKSTSHKLPPIDASGHKNTSKMMIRKMNDTRVEKLQSHNKSKVTNKIKSPSTNEADLSKPNDDIFLFDDRNTSPAMVCDIEKGIIPDCFMEKSDLLEEMSNINSNRRIKDKQRPVSALMPENRKENFDNIILDFNKKLEKIIKDNHLNNYICTHCNKDYDLGHKTAAGKITFFFLKKYGNVGKFILARLNEFLDNVYKTQTDAKETEHFPKTTNDSFPLPCNRNDIEYEGDLKSYRELAKDGVLFKSKTSKSKLPKLIHNKNKICLTEPGHDDESHYEICSKSEISGREESHVSRPKIKVKGKKKVEIKIEAIKESYSVDIGLPPLKPASSIINFYKASPVEISDNMVHKTVHLSTDCTVSKTEPYNDILNKLSFDENLMESEECQFGGFGTDTVCDGFTTFLSSEERNEENISLMANKLIEDLWQSTFISEGRSRSIRSD